MQRSGNSKISPAWSARRNASVIAAGLLLAFATTAWSQPVADPTLFRIFLKAGSAVISWGEFARIGDRVAFSIPLGDPLKPDKLQLVSLPSDVIDWDRTNRYADSVRYRRYADARGDADYKALTDEMARALTAIAFSKDSVARLAAAEEARRRLVEWPAQHYGYRAADVRDLASAVEETIAGIRADAGERHFEINLVATLEPPSEPLMKMPTVQESIELAAAVARATDVKADRVSLQTAIRETLFGGTHALPSAFVSSASRRLKADARIGSREDRHYADLIDTANRDAASNAARADVAGVQAILASIRQQDDKFGRKRPREIAALVTVVEAHLETARQRRLELDRWRYRDVMYGTYRKAIERNLDRLDAVMGAAEAIRSMSGPDVRHLTRTDDRLAAAAVAMLPLTPPDDLRASHDSLVSAIQLMRTAVNMRRKAVMTADLEAARNASAAAAGAILLVNHARDEVRGYFKPPTFR